MAVTMGEIGETGVSLSPKHSRLKSYMSIIGEKHPGYLHELFRYAELICGYLATFSDLADVMNECSAAPSES